jgi:hypothetical protein
LSGERTLRIDLSPSHGLAVIIVAVHGGAAACAGALVAGVAGLCLGVLIAGLGFAAAWDRALLRGRRSVRALRIEGKDRVILELANAESLPMRISPRRYVSGLAVILPGAASMHRTIVVVRDMLEPSSFRALRLWALWGRVPDAGPRRPAGQEAGGIERTIF